MVNYPVDVDAYHSEPKITTFLQGKVIEIAPCMTMIEHYAIDYNCIVLNRSLPKNLNIPMFVFY